MTGWAGGAPLWVKGISDRFSLLSGEELIRLLRLPRLSRVGACGESDGERSIDPIPHSQRKRASRVLAVLESWVSTLCPQPQQCCSGLTWVTRPPIWMGGGVGTEELFTCQARGLALKTRLASLRLAEGDGHLLTRLVPPTPGKSYFCEGGEKSGFPAPDPSHAPPSCSCSIFPGRP